MTRTHFCGALRRTDEGKAVTLDGWVATVRDLGALVFVDVRDREGSAQVVFRTETDVSLAESAKTLRSEDVIRVRGRVKLRDAGAVNKNVPTGEVEVEAESLEILSRADTPPFEISDDSLASEDLRLRHRYLDLRRPTLQRNLAARHKIALEVRKYFDEQGFYEMETPYLFRSTPEGARDYVVPSRLRKGAFYALPQSPQILKQLLMVAGYDRYVQIVRCFRDEDLRATRQPEFTQIDVEMSFVEPEDIFAVVEGMMARALAVVGQSFERPLRRMPYQEAMDRYGADAPDLRFDLAIEDVGAAMRGTPFNAVRGVLEEGGVVRAIVLHDVKEFSRKRATTYEELVKSFGAKGLLWFRVEEGGACAGPTVKHLGEGTLAALKERLALRAGDVLLAVAAPLKVAREAMGRLRLQAAKDENLVDASKHALLWVTEFPAFDYDPEEKRHIALHHPFTSPVEADVPLLESDPLKVRARAYDLVWNGIEMGGGSIRIHRRDVQARVFRVLGLSDVEAQEKFSFLLDALRYGAPPHGGIALGLDRLVMMCLGEENIRNVIAFPKTGNASCLMSGAPSEIEERQLKELGIKLAPSGAEGVEK